MLRPLAFSMAAAFAGPAAAQEPPAYVGSDACTACHTEAAEDWQGSHHALA